MINQLETCCYMSSGIPRPPHSQIGMVLLAITSLEIIVVRLGGADF